MVKICVAETLWFGDAELCRSGNSQGQAIVHACKEPCHRCAVGYQEKSLSSNHPAYLSWESGNHLYLNLIDPPVPMFKRESFDIFLNFADRMRAAKLPILIHCNQGQSRAPTLTLLYMAKRLGLLPDNSYAAARNAFEKQFPYKPGVGIARFFEENWYKIGICN